MPAYTINRRRLLTGAGGLAVLAGAGGSLTACNNSKGGGNTAQVNQGVALPTYKAYSGAKPDLAGTEQGVDPAFRKYPTERPKAVAEKPGDGSTVSGMVVIYTAVPPGPPQNKYWAGLNDRIGVDLKMQMVPNADYAQKFATTIAGNDMPDMVMLNQPPTAIPNLPQLLGARFTNLTEFLSGDAINDYPNLANIPTRTWRSAVYNGGIYGIPIPRGAIGSYHFIRQDLFEKYGVPVDLKGYDALLEGAKMLTSAKDRRWAFGLLNQPRQILGRMNGEANTWRNDGGKLTRVYETEEYKQTINDLITFWKAGVMHPDSFSTTQPFKQLFNGGQVAINAADGYPGWNQYIFDNASNPDFKLGLMPNYTREGSELAKWALGSGYFSVNAIKKQDNPDRVKMILRVMNWMASPFGTEEYTYRVYGAEGQDHTIDENGSPIFTKEGIVNTTLPTRYLTEPPPTIFQPGRPQDADTQHAYQSLEVPTGIADPTIGLFSNANATKNATIDKAFTDGINEIVQGRKPISALDDLIKSWKSGGGDEIRNEYQDQLQSASAAPPS